MQVFFYTESGGEKTATKAILYGSTGGSDKLKNPQYLDDDGKFFQPVYVASPVFAVVVGMTVQDHSTGDVNDTPDESEVAGIAGTTDTTGNWYDADGTTWDTDTVYSIGDEVTFRHISYWAIDENSANNPPDSPSHWSLSFVPVPEPSIAYATWNPADKDAQVALSGGNLIATCATSGNGTARSTIGKASGKWYWENTLTTFVDTQETGVFMGVALATANLAFPLGFDVKGWSYDSENDPPQAGYKYNGFGTRTAYGEAHVQGDVIGVALDMDTGTLVYYKNGVSLGTAYSGLSGTIYAAIGVSNNAPETYVTTSNFGASPFTYTPPVGYNSGLYEEL
jgi:hypothetical protein